MHLPGLAFLKIGSGTTARIVSALAGICGLGRERERSIIIRCEDAFGSPHCL